MSFGIYIGILIFFLGIIIGLPICWVFLASAISTLALVNKSLDFLAGTFYHSLDNYTLMAIAFFIFAGNLMSRAGVADRLVHLAQSMVREVKGGMVAVGIIATLIFSSLTGSAVPCVAAFVPILVEPLEKYGYERRYTTAVLCCCSFLGYLIPPSVPVLFYCLIAHQSVAAVFLSTIIPGSLITIGYLTLNYFISGKYMHNAIDKKVHQLTKEEKLKSLWGSLPALATPIIVIIGIYGGICTSNEVGAIIVMYTVFIGVWVYKTLDKKNLLLCTKDTIVSLGMAFTLLAFGTVFARVFTREGLPQLMANLIIGLFHSKYMVLLMINILLLIMGMFIDGVPILVIVVPMILPLVSNLDINLVHLGAIIVLNVGIGVVTPPFAVSIFVGSRLSGVPYADLIKPILLYLFIVALPVLFLVTYIPALSCWLPNLIMGSKIVGNW